jgi:hypothetical protein
MVAPGPDSYVTFFEEFWWFNANAGWQAKLKPNLIMKSKLQLQIPAAILLFVTSITTASAQLGTPPGAIDPNTGLPLSAPAQWWTDPNWQDPARQLPEVDFQGLPISEVVRQLQLQFTNDLDIIVPNSSFSNPNAAPGSPTNPQPASDYQVTLKLKYVRASEIFNGMNLEFEAESTPLRWQLIMNGGRATAVLRVVQAMLPPPPVTATKPEVKRMVFYVGNLIGTQESGGMTIDQVRITVERTYFTVFQKEVKVNEYPDAQLLIISGTPDDLDFVRQTLEALKQKADSTRKDLPPPPSEPNPQIPEPPSAPEPPPGPPAGAK